MGRRSRNEPQQRVRDPSLPIAGRFCERHTLVRLASRPYASGIQLKTCAAILWRWRAPVLLSEKDQVVWMTKRAARACPYSRARSVPAGGHRGRSGSLPHDGMRESHPAIAQSPDPVDCGHSAENARGGRAPCARQRHQRAGVVRRHDERCAVSCDLLCAVECVLHIAARIGDKRVGQQCQLRERRPQTFYEQRVRRPR